ncbi:MAG TPA: amidophosphoribosyltransferase [Acidimicrobiales bacterium]|jgi:amidophosphoribosyltransferase|nr:amidophosphoribosyltransferase [Acidimicrobiales bacterium]
MKEACGVVGIVAPGRDVAHLCYDALFALQHRGQESAGMATFQNQQITVVKDNGLVSHVFAESTLRALGGSLVIGHTRYSTSGSANWTAAQPVYRSAGASGFALAHNGNLTNTTHLAAEADIEYTSMLSDSDLVAELLAREVERGTSLSDALRVVLSDVEGAFSMVILEANEVHAVRDPYGFRPLCLGRIGTADAPEGWIVASESPALDVIGATFVREISPGEMVTITKDGLTSQQLLEPAEGKQRLCIFEFVYFARPDAYLMGHQVHSTRRRMGELLAQQSNVEADLVMGVPDSGVPAAEGYAKISGIPFGQGLVKNRYIGRTFISPDQNERAKSVRRKLNPLRENIEGQRLIVVDDSIVRGTTTKALVGMLRDAGAKEVHLRISSPPFMWPCYYGIDTPNRDDLLAANNSIQEMNDFIGSDTLEFITLENLRAAVQLDGECCDACLTGTYPAPIPVTLGAVGSRW